jgi:hypothetical protein
VVPGGEPGEERGDLIGAELGGVPHLVVDDEAADPMAVGLLGAGAEVAGAAGGAELLHEPRRSHASEVATSVPV